MNIRQVTFAFLAVSISLLHVNAWASPTDGDYSRKTITLTAPAVIGGILVKAGQVDEFEPGDLLARGVLVQETTIQALNLPANSDVNMESPTRLAAVQLPRDEIFYMISGIPFESGQELNFGYNKWNASLRGKLAYHPQEYPGFPTAGLNPAVFENSVTAACELRLSPSSSGAPRKWGCSYEVILTTPIEQAFGAQTITIPAETEIRFYKDGISSLQLAHDQEFMGLPVSASQPIQVGVYTTGGPQEVYGFSLSRDAEYQGITLSAMGAVTFFEAAGTSTRALQEFTPLNALEISAGGQTLSVAPLKEVQINVDGSLFRGELAFAQTVNGILIPEGARVFFGDHKGSPLESIGLNPFTHIIVNGISYGDTFTDTMFIDFDEHGNIKTVR